MRIRKAITITSLTTAALLGAATPALAGSPHYVGTPTYMASGTNITVSAKEAGLGDEAQVHVILTGTAVCVNGGGQNPDAANKTSFATAADEPVQNGKTIYDITATAVFDPSSPCPDPMNVQFTSLTLTDTTNGLTVTPIPAS